MRLSLLSLIIIASLILLFLKASDMLTKYSAITRLSFISSAHAKEQEAETKPDTEGDSAEHGSTEEDGGKEGKAPPPTNQTVEYTPTELDILQRLSKRRDELEKWEKELDIKENILRITQEKIDHKINELRTLKTDVEKSLEEYNAKETKKIQSLVKIYENMKSTAAAKIFSQLDMETMLIVSEKMKEDKLALILAKMSPELAKKLTVSFAQHGKLIPPGKKTK